MPVGPWDNGQGGLAKILVLRETLQSVYVSGSVRVALHLEYLTGIGAGKIPTVTATKAGILQLAGCPSQETCVGLATNP